MTDYISRELAMEVRVSEGLNDDGRLFVPYEDVTRYLQNLPAADVVEVVRCQNCKYCDDKTPYELWCLGRGWPYQMVPPDGYCDKGKRREAAR